MEVLIMFIAVEELYDNGTLIATNVLPYYFDEHQKALKIAKSNVDNLVNASNDSLHERKLSYISEKRGKVQEHIVGFSALNKSNKIIEETVVKRLIKGE